MLSRTHCAGYTAPERPEPQDDFPSPAGQPSLQTVEERISATQSITEDALANQQRHHEEALEAQRIHFEGRLEASSEQQQRQVVFLQNQGDAKTKAVLEECNPFFADSMPADAQIPAAVGTSTDGKPAETMAQFKERLDKKTDVRYVRDTNEPHVGLHPEFVKHDGICTDAHKHINDHQIPSNYRCR